MSATGNTLTVATTQATLAIVKPQFTAQLSKQFGETDGSDQTVYPLTGIAKAGDLYDPALGTSQNFRDHKLRFVASTKQVEGTHESPGARELTIMDPVVEPTLAQLDRTPFDSIKFTALADAPMQCTTTNDAAVASTTTQQVWVVDDVSTPTSVTLVPFDASVVLDRIVGIKITVTPNDASGRFPTDVSCKSAPGTTVMFRDVRMSDGVAVSPETIGSDATPGLFELGNSAELRTGLNTATALGGDSLYLIDLVRASVYKDYAKDASGHGVQGQNSPTAFLVSGVPARDDARLARIVDGQISGGNIVPGSSFDVFALTGVREAHLGPDQNMTVTFRDANGLAIGPVGTVDASIALEDRDLTPAEIEDSQSAGYIEFRAVKRDITWSGPWATGDMERVASVSVIIERPDGSALQRFGAFSVVIDATLRSHFLSSPLVVVQGSPGGQKPGGGYYQNVAELSSLYGNGAGTWTTPTIARLDYSVFAATELFVHGTADWKEAAPSGDRYLVAKHQTPSLIELRVANRTAVGAAEVDPDKQWEIPGSIGIGLADLSIGVGGAPSANNNPFAITDFAGVTAMTWPLRSGADPDGTEAERRVAATITYTFADSTTLTVAAPVGAPVASLNPPANRWGDVVGVDVTWSESGRFIATTRTNADNTGRLTFRSDLRDYARDGYGYEYVEGVPISVAPGGSIDGAIQDGDDTVDQWASLSADYLGSLPGLATKTGLAQSDRVLIDVAKSAVKVAAASSQAALYRDTGIQSGQTPTTWTLSNTNDGNIPVSGLWLATDATLLDRATWPTTTPTAYELVPGSMFDAFNVTAAEVRLPTGAAKATVWALGENGLWSDPMVVTTATGMLTLPTTGSGPTGWAQVTGFRVAYEADESTRVRIAKQATGSLVLTTQLCSTLRTDPTELAPATDLPSGADHWSVTLTAAGTSHVGTPGMSLEPYSSATTTRTVQAGVPSPLARKYVLSYSEGGPNVTSTTGNPGAWVNFYVVIRNQTAATSNLYNLSMVDSFPSQLHYNAANAATSWRVMQAPSRLGEPVMTPTEGTATTPSTMRWDWPAEDYLRPGEFIVVRVPLQIGDGLAAGATATNTGRVIGTGIADAPVTSVCSSDTSTNTACFGSAYVSSLRADSVRAESYVDAEALGSSTAAGDPCDASAFADWDGTWVRNPCIANTTVGETLTYRLKLINAGNNDLGMLRFVDELPKVGDQGVVLDAPRGSEWTPKLVPGSVRLLTGTEATDLGARGDGELGSTGFRFTNNAKPCVLDPDGVGNQNTLNCASNAATWGQTASTDTKAFGADIGFENGAKLAGGEYVVVEFQMSVPQQTDVISHIAWNSVAVTGRSGPTANWLPAAESPRSGVRTQDADLTVTLGLENGPATRWHLGAPGYTLSLVCTPPGGGSPIETDVQMAGITTLAGVSTAHVSGLPLGGSCVIADENYTPSSTTAAGQYGSAVTPATGYSFATEPMDPVVLDPGTGVNEITVMNSFVESTVELGVEVTGDAASVLPADATFDVQLSCTFGGITEKFGPFAIEAGGTHLVDGLPVGANCTATEVDARGATEVTAAVDGVDAAVDATLSTELVTIEPGAHTAVFTNRFTIGGALQILKRIETPDASLAVGDVEFAVSCRLGGHPIDLGDRATQRHTFGKGETSVLLPVNGLPVGAECTVSETKAGGADKPAPDRTVTVLADEDVTVEMVNVFDPAALELSKVVTGPGASESRVPGSFGLRATCTRELTIDGEAVTVTDFDAMSNVSPNSPITIGSLPRGSSCTVTEPELRGAESVAFSSLTPGVENTAKDSTTAEVKLAGTDAEGNVVATEVRATNRYAATGGLKGTGSAAPLVASGVALALLIAGLAFLGRKRRRTAE